MDISNATAASVGAIVNNPQPQPSGPKNGTQPEKQQDSIVVKLSEQAKQMNRAKDQNINTERAETRPQENAEPPGIQFMEGEKKGGRINTFA
jgi:anti-sigma28 factor (negative regulator of flagellin synthesis)